MATNGKQNLKSTTAPPNLPPQMPGQGQKPQKLIIPTELAEQVFQYLSTQPFKDVAGLIRRLEQELVVHVDPPSPAPPPAPRVEIDELEDEAV